MARILQTVAWAAPVIGMFNTGMYSFINADGNWYKIGTGIVYFGFCVLMPLLFKLEPRYWNKEHRS